MRSKLVAKNSLLTALDQSVGLIVAFLTAGIVARHLGPAKMGQYAFALWLASTMSVFVAHGVGSALGKFMAESVGRGDWPVAKSMVRLGIRVQLASAILLVGLSLLYVAFRVPEGQRLYTSLVLLTLLPGLMSVVPTLANIACEDFASNIIPALVSTILQPIGIFLALTCKLELTGLALGYLSCRTIDCVLRFWFFRNRFDPATPIVPLPPELLNRMSRFFWQSSALLVLDLVVWEKSEIYFLNQFSTKIQLAFYSTGFSLSGMLLSMPNAFAGAAGASLMVERGRNPQALNRFAATMVRYQALMILPMSLGLAAISGPVIRIMYGPEYVPAIPVFALMTLLVIPKAVVGTASAVLRAVEKQGFSVKWMMVSAVATVALDYWLIPRYGAMGAAWGNGLAQWIAAAGVWTYAIREEKIRLPWGELSRMVAAACTMGAAAYSVTLFLPSVFAIIVGVPVGAVVYFVLMRLFRVFSPEDGPRFLGLATQLPRPLQSWFSNQVRWIVGEAKGTA